MNLLGGIIGGLIGGIIGALAWAGIVYVTEYEIGYIAVGIGALVGFGVALGSKEGGPVPGVIAVLIAAASIVGGKWLAVEWSHDKWMEAAAEELGTNAAMLGAVVEASGTDAKAEMFKESFGGIDLLFFGIAVVVAFGIANKDLDGQ